MLLNKHNYFEHIDRRMSDNNKDAEKKPKKNPAPTARSVKRRKKKGPANAVKIPQSNDNPNPNFVNLFTYLFVYLFACLLVFPTSKCKLRLLKLERIKDFLLMEEEFIQNQEFLRPRVDQDEVSKLVFVVIVIWLFIHLIFILL